MLDEKTRALLGDREAQEAFTARGELLPCPCCGGTADIGVDSDCDRYQEWNSIFCTNCWIQMNGYRTYFGVEKEEVPELIAKWNHRPPLLTPTQMAVLGRMEATHDE